MFGPAAVRDGIEQADLLLMAGVDALVLETVRFGDALAFVQEMRPRITVPLVVSLFEPEVPLGFAARALVDAGADVVGANCQADLMQADLEVEALSATVFEIPLWLKPGGGLPGGGLQDPRSFAERTQHWIDRGVRFLGGCCGTTPEHLAAMRSVLDQKRDALEPLRR